MRIAIFSGERILASKIRRQIGHGSREAGAAVLYKAMAAEKEQSRGLMP